MRLEDIHAELEGIFRDVIDDDIVLTDELSAEDVDAWDSVAHVNLLFAIEDFFGIAFTQREMATMANVGDLKQHILNKV